MITIIKGKEKIVCTYGTFQEQYKQLGYQIASNKEEATPNVASFIEEKDNQKVEENKKDEELENEKIMEKYGLNKKTKTKTKTTKKGKKNEKFRIIKLCFISKHAIK